MPARRPVCRRGDARSLFARSQQRRLLAGRQRHPTAAFYSYAYPTPEGFADAPVPPGAASFIAALGEFLLPYEAVRTAADPEAALLEFLQITYEAAAIAATGIALRSNVRAAGQGFRARIDSCC